MRSTRLLSGLIGLVLLSCSLTFATEPGSWSDATAPLIMEDINTTSKMGQWTETFADGRWGVGSWVDGNATNAAGELIWKLQGPIITKSHPSVLFDTNRDGLPDMIQTHYQGGTFTIFDAPGLWGAGAVFDCEDTFIEDHFDPIKKRYEYGYVSGIAVNKKLGLTVYLDARVIETSGGKSCHSGELTSLKLVIVPELTRKAIEKQFPIAHIRRVREKKNAVPYSEVDFVYQGKKIRATVSREGVLGNVRSIVKFKDLPAPVTETIKEKLKGNKILKIERRDCFANTEAGKWIALDRPTRFFVVKYIDAGQAKNIFIEHVWQEPPNRDNNQRWGHNGKPVQPYSAGNIIKKKAGDLLDNFFD